MKNDLIKLTRCLKCESSQFNSGVGFYECKNCNHKIEYKNNKLYFSKNFFDTKTWDGSNLFNFDIFERKTKINMPDIIHGPKIKDLRNYLNLKDSDIAINLGGGSNKFEKIINFDLGNYDAVDIIGDLENLPFRNDVADLIISNSVLEHVKNYEKALYEAKRILKNNGFFYLCVPCVSVRHHKYDFWRWTMPGLVELVENLNFEIIEKGSCRGPEMMLWYALETYVVYRTKPGIIREVLRKIALFFAKKFQYSPLKKNDKAEALSVTNYVICKKR
tara:strand:+ start:97 stop:921 length:825 start_codon:yes stop_codon:yes gene_type:complete